MLSGAKITIYANSGKIAAIELLNERVTVCLLSLNAHHEAVDLLLTDTQIAEYLARKDARVSAATITLYFTTSGKIEDIKILFTERVIACPLPLFFAAEAGQARIVELLLSKGHATESTCDGKTPLFVAVQNGQQTVVEILLSAKADLQRKCNGITPLFCAVIAGHEKLVKLLLSYGAEKEGLCHGETPLFAAVKRGNEAVVEILLNAKVDINKQCYGVTPLFCAAAEGHERIVELLLAYGADKECLCMEKPLYLPQ